MASLALALVFQLSHCVIEAEFVDPAASSGESYSWQIHQIESTVDFAKGNGLLRFYTGGLNHQIEHHLYSRLPHTLYPRIAPIVEAAAGAHGITYTHHPTIRQAMRSHTQWLKMMGARPARQQRSEETEPAAHSPRGSCGRRRLAIAVRNPAAIEVV